MIVEVNWVLRVSDNSDQSPTGNVSVVWVDCVAENVRVIVGDRCNDLFRSVGNFEFWWDCNVHCGIGNAGRQNVLALLGHSPVVGGFGGDGGARCVDCEYQVTRRADHDCAGGRVLITVELFNVLSPNLRTRFTYGLAWVWCNISWRQQRSNAGRSTVVRVLAATRPHITNNALYVRIKVLSSERIVWLCSGQA